MTAARLLWRTWFALVVLLFLMGSHLTGLNNLGTAFGCALALLGLLIVCLIATCRAVMSGGSLPGVNIGIRVLDALGFVEPMANRHVADKAALAIFSVGCLTVAWIGCDASQWLESRRVESEYRRMLDGVDRGDIDSAGDCLYQCRADERPGGAGRDHFSPVAEIVLKAYGTLPAPTGEQLTVLLRAHAVLAETAWVDDSPSCIQRLLAAMSIVNSPRLWEYQREINPRGIPGYAGTDTVAQDAFDLTLAFIVRLQTPLPSTDSASRFDCHRERWRGMSEARGSEAWWENHVCEQAEATWRARFPAPPGKQASGS